MRFLYPSFGATVLGLMASFSGIPLFSRPRSEIQMEYRLLSKKYGVDGRDRLRPERFLYWISLAPDVGDNSVAMMMVDH